MYDCLSLFHYIMFSRSVRIFISCLTELIPLSHRAVYRACELAQGWSGTIIINETYFSKYPSFILSPSLTIFVDVCDGGMMVLVMYALNIIHPGFFLSSRTSASCNKYTTHQLDPGRRLSSKSFAAVNDNIYDSYNLAVCVTHIRLFLCFISAKNISPNNLTTFGFFLLPDVVGRIMLHPNQEFYVLELLNTDCTLSDDAKLQVFSQSGSDRFAVLSCGQVALGGSTREHVYYLFPTYQYDITYGGQVVRTVIVSDTQ